MPSVASSGRRGELAGRRNQAHRAGEDPAGGLLRVVRLIRFRLGPEAAAEALNRHEQDRHADAQCLARPGPRAAASAFEVWVPPVDGEQFIAMDVMACIAAQPKQ